MFRRLRRLIKQVITPHPTKRWIAELTEDLRRNLSISELDKLPPKSRYIEETLDWSETRQLELIEDSRLGDAVSLSAEFYDWAKAPSGFDHDLLVSSGKIK